METSEKCVKSAQSYERVMSKSFECKLGNWLVFMIKDLLQIWLLILSEFKQINFYSPLNHQKTYGVMGSRT